ncbi:hypothetical protein KY358_04260 [Candidatus Woesearchaeota archaeon]|nr:hypothetical protein [Candidatus Woesearchaeota archaeon]
MGNIIGSKVAKNGNMLHETLIDYDESLQLKGHVRNVHIFSEDAPGIDLDISSRGKEKSTRYLLIPMDVRKGISLKNKVRFQKLETSSKVILIYAADKARG